MSTAITFTQGTPAEFWAAVNERCFGVMFPATTTEIGLKAATGARRADWFAEDAIGRHDHYFAAFGATGDQIAIALSITRLLRGYRGAQFFVPFKLLPDTSRPERVLQCYLEACDSSDWKAHCLTVASEERLFDRPGQFGVAALKLNVVVSRGAPAQDPPPLPSRKYLLPCALMLRHGMKLQEDHPATLRDQIQARAVEMSCEWCPRFSVKEFQQI